ncbi:MAG: hypothetical protein Q8M22_05045, partial [Actinomycetota bacterium]|nr:hypothetical protein [Actinomycetota bacterium]
ATPRYQSQELSFDLRGEGLSPIAGGFRVFMDIDGYLSPLQVTVVSDTTLHVTGYAYVNGTFDIVTQWTAADGTTRESRCVGCISAYSPLQVFAPWEANAPRGSTTTMAFSGSGLADLTKVRVSGTGVSVESWSIDEYGQLVVAIRATATAAVGSRDVTVTRRDGATAIATIQVT